MVDERVRCPGEHGGRRLMTCDEQGDQIVAHLLIIHLLSAEVDEAAQHRRILDLIVVLILKRLELERIARRKALVDELVEHTVE